MKEKRTHWTLVLGDLASVLIATALAFLVGSLLGPEVTGWTYPHPYEAFADRIWSFPVALGVLIWRLDARSHYSGRQPFWIEARDIGAALLVAFLVEGFVQYLGKDQLSRLWIAQTWIFAYPVMLLLRRLTKGLVIARGGDTPVLLLGAEKPAQEAAAALLSDRLMGYRIMGIRSVPAIKDLDRLLSETGAKKVVIVLSGVESQEASSIALALSARDVPFSFAIPSSGMGSATMDSKSIIGHDMVFLNEREGLLRPATQAAKRLMDIILSSIALLVSSPILIVLFFLVRADGGPAFFGHTRIGRNGAPFRCLKFRTMNVDAAERLEALLRNDEQARREWQDSRKLKHDPRVTTHGRLLRALALDELPQLWNVLVGEMSLVGPRPVTGDELEVHYGTGREAYLAVRPGLTGLWQASGRNEIGYQRRVEMDAWYVRNWSTWIDIVLMAKTIPTLLSRRGAS